MLVKPEDLKPSVTRRLLEEAIAEIEELKKPRHGRGRPKKEKGPHEEDADDENDKKVALSEERGKPTPIDLDDEDMPDRAMDKLKPAVKKSVSKASQHVLKRTTDKKNVVV